MTIVKNSFLFIILLASLIMLPVHSLANSMFNQGPSLNDSVTKWTNSINSLAPQVSFLFSALFTIMFLFGIVRLGYAMVTKTGQVMKGSTGLLIWVPISFYFIRVFIILLFTTNTTNVTLLASDIIRLISSAGYFTALGMALIGLVMFMFYKFIKHPEFGRWSKRLWGSAALLTVLVQFIPIVLGAA